MTLYMTLRTLAGRALASVWKVDYERMPYSWTYLWTEIVQ